ncbi:MAG TPA: DUF4129 domain-containing protein [Candidatus Limnocylindria bacterium]
MPRADAQRTVAVLLVARNLVEGVLFAAIFSGAQVLTNGDRPIPVVTVTLALTGIGIILASILRDARAERQNTAIALVAMGGAGAIGIVYAAPQPDVIMIMTRVILFGIIGEAFVWRNVTIARSLVRWADTRNAGFAAIGAIAVVALLPGAVDRSALALAALAATAAAGIGLSLARSAEELTLAGREARGGTDRGTASGTAVLLAVLAIIGAAAAPYLGDLLRTTGDAITPIIGGLLFGVLLALGYVAELFVTFIRSFFSGFTMPPIRQFAPPLSPQDEAEALRQMEATRPYLVGFIEIVVAAIALVVVVVLVERMSRERRETLPEGATLEREVSIGDGIGAFLAGLLPRRTRRPAAPRDDGTPSGALRALYWRYLARSEARGISWRGVGETPTEHHRRALLAGPGQDAATGLVRAFEDLRYGERIPDEETVAAARSALASLERPA